MLRRYFVSVMSAIALGSGALPSQAQIKVNGDLSIAIEGLRNQRGQICLNLFDKSQGFPVESKQAIKAQCVRLNGEPPTVTFRNLKTGSYAVSVIHDANNDGTLNRNGLGIPLEGFGFSRNPRIVSGPPKFSDSAVIVVGASTNIQIRMLYFLGG
jgi:uncharacterized protein (DUF2141 family)